MVTIRFFAIFFIFSVISAEPVRFKDCPGDAALCTIDFVDIEPCREASSNRPCKIKRGRLAQISFNYTAEFDAKTLESRAYWATEVDLPLMDMDTNGCYFTECPVVNGTQQAFNQTLYISRKFPVGTYDIKWQLTSGEFECCFITAIKLVR